MTRARQTDNRDPVAMISYYEARIEALIRRIRELESEKGCTPIVEAATEVEREEFVQ